MAETIGQYQVGAYATPVNGGTLDASVVLGNDNTTRASHNSHDNDPGVHFQSSALAARPAASIAGRKWITSDGLRVYYDTGAAWSEIAYVSLAAGGTIAAGGLAITAGNIGVGGPQAANIGVNMVPTLTTNVAQYGANLDPTFNATCTSAIVAHVRPNTVAAAFTITDLKGIFVADTIKGAGSAVTTQYGVYVSALAAGGTNWAVYTDGVTPSRFGGAVTVAAGGITVSAGGVSVTGNSTINGTLGSLTGLTLSSGQIITPAGSVGVPSIRIGTTDGFYSNAGLVGTVVAGMEAFRVTSGGAADEMRIMVFDETGAALKRVSRGAADSGGVGFRALRIPN